MPNAVRCSAELCAATPAPLLWRLELCKPLTLGVPCDRNRVHGPVVCCSEPAAFNGDVLGSQCRDKEPPRPIIVNRGIDLTAAQIEGSSLDAIENTGSGRRRASDLESRVGVRSIGLAEAVQVSDRDVAYNKCVQEHGIRLCSVQCAKQQQESERSQHSSDPWRITSSISRCFRQSAASSG